MKKTLAAIVALALCLSLCACSGVKQEDFDAAVAKYDALAEEHEALKKKVEPYTAIIDALEAEDYDGAAEALEALRPAPEVTEVEITMDNLWDYFEITEDRTEQTDAQGNLYNLQISRVISLKSNYALASQNEYPTDVAVGYEYDWIEEFFYTPCEIDFETFTCDQSAANRITQHESKLQHITKAKLTSLYTIFANCPVDQSSNTMGVLRTVENFEILNASGTLYLANK